MGHIGKNLLAYFFWFVAALFDQLWEDDNRWGDEWKNRPIEETAEWDHQNTRVIARIFEYYHEWVEDGTPVPWLKVVGNAFIAWVREEWPEEYMLKENESE